jgi:hypothetical protein
MEFADSLALQGCERKTDHLSLEFSPCLGSRINMVSLQRLSAAAAAVV